PSRLDGGRGAAPGEGTTPGALLRLRGGGSGPSHPEGAPERLGEDRRNRSELRRLSRRERSLPPARPLRHPGGDERVLRPGAELPLRLLERRRLLQQPDLVPSGARRPKSHVAPPQRDLHRLRPGRVGAAGVLATAGQCPREQGHRAPAGSLGPRHAPRLAHLAKDAALCARRARGLVRTATRWIPDRAPPSIEPGPRISTAGTSS